MQISNKEYKNKYKCILYSPLHLNDCISAMCLHDNKILIGTLMGVSQLIIINKDETNDSYSHIIKTITKVITEHISCVYINNNSNINIGISSSKIVHVDVDKVLTLAINESDNEQQHDTNLICPMNDKCKSKSKDCTCMMANNRLLIIHTKFEDKADSPINKLNFEYENRNLSDSNNSKCGEITSTNFSVPFDFDGDRYVYIEYISKTKRKLCVYYTLTFVLII